jgi:glycosyltransferase involved in cell wall biosynthesis
MVDVSVIVPFLNEQQHIGACIESLLGQTMEANRYELIFVDNGSVDRSVEIVGGFPRVTLVKEDRRHVYTARNTAITCAQGRILAFTDADCVVSTDWLSSLVREIDDCGADIVLGERDFARSASRFSRFLKDYENKKIEYILINRQYHRCFGYTNNMAVRKSVYDSLGGFRDDIPLADTDFVARYVDSGPDPKISYSNSARIVHQEIATWRDWIAKLWSYGKDSPESGIALYISFLEQRRFYRWCFENLDYSPVQRIAFTISASCANLAFVIPYLMRGGRAKFGSTY